MTNIFILDDQNLLTDEIKLFLKDLSDIRIVAGTNDIQKLKGLLTERTIDLIIMGIKLPMEETIEIIEYIKINFPRIKILMLSTYENEELIHKIIKAGVDGYILKNSKKEEFLNALQLVSKGMPYVSHVILLKIIRKYSSTFSSRPKSHVRLSKREIEILGLIADGYTNSEIAEKTFTSKRTIETHRKNLLEKTGSNNSASLIKFGVLNHFIK